MEVTTVSPSPASPTEGDDLCETDVSNVAIHSVTLLICLCGLAGNGAVLRLYSMESRTYAVFHLALADFLFLLFTVPSALLVMMEDLSCSPILPLIYLSFIFQLSVVSYFWGLFRLMFNRNVADMYKLLQICCHCDLPLRLWLVVESFQDWPFFALFTVIPMVSSSCPSHEQEQCRAALISIYIIILLLFAAPVVISRAILLIKAKCGSQQQQPKKRDLVIFIIVLFTLLLSLCNFLQQLGHFPESSEVFFLFTCIHSSIKPFIYFLAGRCWSPCSMKSLQLLLQRLFVKQKEITASRDDDPRDTGVC